MTDLLRKVVAKVEALPPQQQDFYAQMLLEEIESERQWDELFSRPLEGTKLEQLVREAKSDIRAGRTFPLNELLEDGDKPQATQLGQGRRP